MPHQSTAIKKNTKNEGYRPALWEKIIVVVAAFLIITVVVFLLWRNDPIADPNLVVMARTMLSLAIAALGACVPGFLHVDCSRKGLAIRSSGAMSLFVLTYTLTPQVLLQPVPPPGPNTPGLAPPLFQINEDFSSIETGKLPSGWNGDAAIRVQKPEGSSKCLELREVGTYTVKLPRLEIDKDFFLECSFDVYQHEREIKIEFSGENGEPYSIRVDQHGDVFVHSYPKKETKLSRGKNIELRISRRRGECVVTINRVYEITYDWKGPTIVREVSLHLTRGKDKGPTPRVYSIRIDDL